MCLEETLQLVCWLGSRADGRAASVRSAVRGKARRAHRAGADGGQSAVLHRGRTHDIGGESPRRLLLRAAAVLLPEAVHYSASLAALALLRKLLKTQLFTRFSTCTHTHTHTRLTAHCPGLPGWAGTRKVKPIWILLRQETVRGSGISWTICKSAPRSRQITTPAPHHSVFYKPDALHATQPAASKH